MTFSQRLDIYVLYEAAAEARRIEWRWPAGVRDAHFKSFHVATRAN